MAVAAIADQVHDDGCAEGIAIIERDFAHADDGIRIFRIYVKNRHGQALGKIGGEARRTNVARDRGETDQIIHDDAHGTAHGESGNSRHVQRLGANALPRKCGVAVHGDGDHLLAAVLTTARLFSARAADDHRVGGFEVAGVGNEMNADVLSVGSMKIAGGADVIFHVTAAQSAAGIDILEASENFGGCAPDDVRHHIEAAAMAHGQHGSLRALFGGCIQDRIEQGQQRDFPFERVTLGAEIARLENLFEDFSTSE